MTFVELFLQHTKHYESPTAFWRWSAFTAISAVLRDNCYRPFGDNKIYPNIYTLLLAESAAHRKGEPVRLCEVLVRTVKNTKIISGRSSIQAILDELGKGETDKQTGKLISGGSALFSARELAAAIVQDMEAVNILTDIYDFHPQYVSRLRGTGQFEIKNLCFSMLAASNEELLIGVYDKKAVYGGLLGRTFLVKNDEFRPGNSLFELKETGTSFNIMAETLKKISLLKGEFDFTFPAVEAYNDWYYPFRQSYKDRSDKSGISGRIHTSVIKLAMILAANELSLTINDRHVGDAIKYCIDLLPNYNKFVMASGKSTVAEVASVLIEEIWRDKRGFLLRKDFLQKHFHQFDLESVEKCTATLLDAGFLKTFCPGGSEVGYIVTEKCIEVFKLKREEQTNESHN